LTAWAARCSQQGATSAISDKGGNILGRVVVAERFPQKQVDCLLSEARPPKNALRLSGEQLRGPNKLVVGEIKHPVIVADKHVGAQPVSWGAHPVPERRSRAGRIGLQLRAA
jgi:hypothetical protein